jgi:hypothetical protein
VALKNDLFCRVALLRTDISEEPSTSFIRVTRIGELGTMLAVTSNRRTLRRNTKEALSSSETSVPTKATWRNIPEDDILHSHRREDLKSDRSGIATSSYPVAGLFHCKEHEGSVTGCGAGVEPSPLSTVSAATYWPVVPALDERW